jgi:serine/threonine protein kinase
MCICYIENILLHGTIAKVADFSMARGIHETEPVTSYVSTRWYRAPEMLLLSKQYNCPADLFAVGCIYSEMHTGMPLFPGFDEVDQLHKIFAVVGTPMDQGWHDGIMLLQKSYRVITWPPQRTTLAGLTLMNGAAVHLLAGLLRLDPLERITAEQALAHAVFRPFMSHRKRSSSPATTAAVTPAACNNKTKTPMAVTISPKANDGLLRFPALMLPPEP